MYADLPLDLDPSLVAWAGTAGTVFLAVLAAGLTARLVFGRRRPQDGPPRDLVLRAAAKGVNPFHDPFVAGSAGERRHAPRRRGGLVEVDVSDATGAAEPVRGRVVDRSVEGMCLWVEEAVPEHTILSVRPARQTRSGWVQVEVRSCRAEDDGFEIGCRYVVTPTWSVRMLFG